MTINHNDARWDDLADLIREVRNLNWDRYSLLLEWDEIIDRDAILTGDELDQAIVALRREANLLKEEN